MLLSKMIAVALATLLALATPGSLSAQGSDTEPDQASDQAPWRGWDPGAMMHWFYGMMGDDWDRGRMMGRGRVSG